MTHTHVFSFNPFQTNTYLFWDESKEAIVVDAAMYTEDENDIFKNFVLKNDLKIKQSISTHSHLDHIMGNRFIKEEYGITPIIHKGGVQFLDNAAEYANSFGLNLDEVIRSDEFIEDGDFIEFGNSKFKVIYTPGHAEGSICLYNEADSILVAGDVLFNRGIGRTDLPTGDYSTLIKSIKEKLFVLPEETVVYPGHGPKTKIGEEKAANPYVD